MALPRDGLTGCEKKKLQMHITLRQAWLLTSPLAAPTPKKGLHEHGAPSRGLVLVLRGAAPIPVPQAMLRRGEEAYPLGFAFFPGMERKLLGFRAQREESWAFPLLGKEQIHGG